MEGEPLRHCVTPPLEGEGFWWEGRCWLGAGRLWGIEGIWSGHLEAL